MKRIGIITTSYAGNGTFACNYGAALQGYALVKQLRLLGFEAYDINYNSDNTYNPMQYGVIIRTLKRIRLLFNAKLVRNKLELYVNRSNLQIVKKKFIEFIRENDLIFENGNFYTLEELSEISDSFYAFITGSDVVWNPYLHNNINDEGFFLNFAKAGVRRIAYAPSLGVTAFPDTAKSDLKGLLQKFDTLSVREKQGADLIFDITGIKVPVVLDPTMLLEPKHYNEITKLPDEIPQEYILVYKFGNIEYYNMIIDKIRDYLGIPVICIPAGKSAATWEIRYDVGPSEYIGLIKNAKIVLTDSFHCTAFCLINHTPFLAFYRTFPQGGRELNSRIINLLDMVRMKDRLVLPDEPVNYGHLLNLDFNQADKIIRSEREKSLQYLITSLDMKNMGDFNFC